jgi:DNA-binding IclR family transcriptional regulator
MPASPPIRRAAAVLTELARAPEEQLSLSEIARRVGLGKSSCQGILQALVEDGLLVRGDHLRYRLGPRLIHLGEAAKLAHDIRGIVTPALHQLRDQLGVTVFATVPSGSDSVVIATAAADEPWGTGPRLGQRLPFSPPFGQAYTAWSTPEEVQAWLVSAPQPLSDAQRHAFLDSLAMVRERGCSITVRPHRDPEFEEWPNSDLKSVWPIPDASVIASTHSLELPAQDEGVVWTVLGLSAPVLDFGDDPVCVIGVAPLPFGMRRDQIFEAARHVTDAAASASRSYRGLS